MTTLTKSKSQAAYEFAREALAQVQHGVCQLAAAVVAERILAVDPEVEGLEVVLIDDRGQIYPNRVKVAGVWLYPSDELRAELDNITPIIADIWPLEELMESALESIQIDF